MKALLGDAQAQSIAVSAMGLATAVLPLVAAMARALWRRPPSLTGHLVLTRVEWQGRRGVLTPRQLARRLRWGAVGFSAFNIGFIASQTVQPAPSAASAILRVVAVAVGVWALVGSTLLIVNIDVRRAAVDSFSKAHAVVELSLAGDPLDVVAELHRFLRRHRFETRFCDYDPCTGTLVFAAWRLWAGPFTVPQDLAIVGRVSPQMTDIAALTDVRPVSRTDFGTCEKNLQRLVAHFSAAPPPRPN